MPFHKKVSSLSVPAGDNGSNSSTNSIDSSKPKSESVSPTPQPQKKTPADFEFLDLLGEGSYAYVQLAEEKATGRRFAIKILDKKHIIKNNKVKYVSVEKDVFSKLNSHPGFVKLYATFQDAEQLYFVLSYAENGELLHYIRKLGAFPLPCARWYAAELVSAMEFMHSSGIIHRDLKPENILLSGDMHIKITDFGTARLLETDVLEGRKDPLEPANNTLDRRSSFVGTAEYVSPELLTAKTTSTSSDLWALGCIVYQMVAGQPPFKCMSEYQTFQRVMSAEYDFPEGFPEDAKDLVHKLIVLDPDARLGSPASGGYAALKAHPFFEGIDWDHLFDTSPPELKPYLPPAQEGEPLTSEINKGGDGLAAHTSVAVRDDEHPDDRIFFPCAPERDESASAVVQDNSAWSALVDNEPIVYTAPIHKRWGLFYKSRQLVLTNTPRLVLASMDGSRIREEIPWSSELNPELKNNRYFFVHTPQRTYYFEDLAGKAPLWVYHINEVAAANKGAQPSS